LHPLQIVHDVEADVIGLGAPVVPAASRNRISPASRITEARYVGVFMKVPIHAANRGCCATHASLRSGTSADGPSEMVLRWNAIA
jgi:hypothetical protein